MINIDTPAVGHLLFKSNRISFPVKSVNYFYFFFFKRSKLLH